MGLEQSLYVMSFTDKRDFSARFFAKDYMTEDKEWLFECFELEYFIKNNILQGYFEEKYNIDNCEFVRVSDEDVEYLINTCDRFLEYFSKDFIQEVQDYYDLALEKYAKKYKDDYSDVKIDQSNAGKISTEFFDNLDQKFMEIIQDNEECFEIIKEELPITEGFFYGEYNLNISYLESIIEIKNAFENVKQCVLGSDEEETYYYCWY